MRGKDQTAGCGDEPRDHNGAENPYGNLEWLVVDGKNTIIEKKNGKF